MNTPDAASTVERRVLTWLVVDVVGSTDLLAVRLGPDRLKGELNHVFAAFKEIVESSGGEHGIVRFPSVEFPGH